MTNEMMHLAKITLANLPVGTINPTEIEIIRAMTTAIVKEKNMGEQLYKSWMGNRELFDSFTHAIAGTFYDAVNQKQ